MSIGGFGGKGVAQSSGLHGERPMRGEAGCLACQWSIEAEREPRPVDVSIDVLPIDFWMGIAEELDLSMRDIPSLGDDGSEILSNLRRDIALLGEGRRSISATVLYIPAGLSINGLVTKFKNYWDELYPGAMGRLRESIGTRKVERGYWIAITNVILKGATEEAQAMRLGPLGFTPPNALDILAVAIVVEQVRKKIFFERELVITHEDRSAQTATMAPVHTKCLEKIDDKDVIIGSWVRPTETRALTPTLFPIGRDGTIEGEEFILGDDFKVTQNLIGVCAAQVLKV